MYSTRVNIAASDCLCPPLTCTEEDLDLLLIYEHTCNARMVYGSYGKEISIYVTHTLICSDFSPNSYNIPHCIDYKNAIGGIS
jgi:hypothetical protein